MKTKQLNVNFRWDNKEGYLFAVIGKKIGDKYTCNDLSSGEHFEATKEYIRTTEVAAVKKGLPITHAINQLNRVGYSCIDIKRRMYYNK